MSTDGPIDLQCPACQSTRTTVIDSRGTLQGQAVRRRRCCIACKYRFTTYESRLHPEMFHINHERMKVLASQLRTVLARIDLSIEEYEDTMAALPVAEKVSA